MVNWSGCLLGLTPAVRTVGSAADLSVTLDTLAGQLDFTGGDDGIVTGAFFGASHEGAGGTLLRSDLTAAFGAVRQ